MLSVKDILQPENVSYTDNVWTWAVAHMLHKGDDWQITTITDTAPIEIIFLSKGEPLTDYLVSGNTVQDGTPTPEVPVDVAGGGLWDETHQSYKLPITVNDTEYPIYLGQVETTRKIKKLVLKGDDTETHISAYSGDNRFFTYILGSRGLNALISTHFNIADISSASTDVGARIVGGTDLRMRPKNVRGMTVDGFKAWLAAQYAAGTPVTIWYVLAEPETAIVNEPLMKIGDYADAVSMEQAGVTIPTVAGANTLTIDTAVQPSNVSITGQIKPVTA